MDSKQFASSHRQKLPGPSPIQRLSTKQRVRFLVRAGCIRLLLCTIQVLYQDIVEREKLNYALSSWMVTLRITGGVDISKLETM